jgi:hypothetical protein
MLYSQTLVFGLEMLCLFLFSLERFSGREVGISGSISSTFYSKLLLAKIPKAQKDTMLQLD